MKNELIDALREKLGQLEKIRNNLKYTHEKVARWWRVDSNFDDWNQDQLELLAAFKARFAELQDHLASAMKLIANIEGERSEAFTYVLNYMAQIYVIESAEEWRNVRDLRNAATHDYSDTEEAKAIHFHRLIQHTHYLYETLEKLERFADTAYPIKQSGSRK